MVKKFVFPVFVFALGVFTGILFTHYETRPVEEKDEGVVLALKQKIAELESELSKLKLTTESTVPSPVATVVQAPDPKATESPTVPVESEVPKIPIKNWRSVERSLPQIRSQAELGRFLERVRIDDFMAEVQAVRPITQHEEIIEYLNGNFSGAMTSQSDIPNFNIVFDANIRVHNEKLKGRVNIRLSRNGKPFSRGSNNGDIQNVQRFGEKSLAVLVNAGDFFFQLYYLPQLESFEGNCYQQIKPGVMKFAGTVHLERI